ncbi:MAG: hypothetical protein ACLGI8_11435 [Acidimicrobiia bacterium]
MTDEPRTGPPGPDLPTPGSTARTPRSGTGDPASPEPEGDTALIAAEVDDGRPGDRRRRRRALVAVLATCALALVGTAAVVGVRWGDDPRPTGAWTLLPYQGLGAWVDVYDWTEALGGPEPSVGLEDLDAMADAGVQTLFLQTAHNRIPGAVAEPKHLDELIDRAHDNGMFVVAWYLPTLVDVGADLERLVASAALDVDGLGVDIESIEVEDPTVRTERLLDLTADLRTELGEDKALSAITLTPVHLEVLNPDYWPGYPWAELGRAYDVIQPMAYWSIRTGELRSGERYVFENLERLRALAGDEVRLHPVGGIADEVTDADLDGMVTAVEAHLAIGGSLYDWATSSTAQWDRLAPLRDIRQLAPDGE